MERETVYCLIMQNNQVADNALVSVVNMCVFPQVLPAVVTECCLQETGDGDKGKVVSGASQD